MGRNTPRTQRPPLDQRGLRDLALHYAARFATTRARLIDYLRRKLRERGWQGDAAPDLDALADDFVANGYVDDPGYARAKAESLGRRGYGGRRIAASLQQAGIEPALRERVVEEAGHGAIDAAIALARRRRFGPFGAGAADPDVRRKQIAAMIRAGHGFDVAKRIVSAADEASLAEER